MTSSRADLRMLLPAVSLLLLVLAPLGNAFAQPAASGFGGTFRQLRPQQQELMRRWVNEYGTIFKRQLNAEALYNQLPMSARTTFQAVTHALLNSKLTSEDGKPMGTALDLIDLVERISGQVPHARGDRQFRIYVYLKPGALNKLQTAREFERGHDNAVYHIGYPINFRQQGGVPSIQISVARTGKRADIDVDYRSSSPVKALVSGHLTSANSDVRAGNNALVHNRRWAGLSDWWRELMAVFIEKPAPEEPADGITPGAEAERKRIAQGPIYEAIHAYLNDWLIKRRPEELLPLFSIKAYPCVAELGGDARPDSRLALVRILEQMKSRNRALGVVNRLEDVVSAVSYRLPDSAPVSHPYVRLFSLQEVPEDVAWAIDCRVRYKLQLAEPIPRPPHKFNKTFVASMRIKDPKEPQSFVVQAWAREGSEWRLTSIDVKRKTMSPSANLLAGAVSSQVPDADSEGLSEEAGKLLERWLMKKQPAEAAKYFLPESFACNAYAESHPAGREPTTADSKHLMVFLDEVAKDAVPAQRLDGVIASVEAEHHELKPLPHSRSAAFLLSEIRGDLLRMGDCGFDPRTLRSRQPAKQPEGKGLATSFRLIQVQGEEGGAITLYWKRSSEGWRVYSYAVIAD